MTSKKTIGILGGISPESTIKYYDHIIKQYYVRHRDFYYPGVVIYSLDFQRFTDFENSGDKAGYVDQIWRGISALQKAGADFIIMAANSPHAVFAELERLAAVPMLSIVEVTAAEAQRRGLQQLLLTGIKFTMQASFYPDACRARGISVSVPTDAEQIEIDRIIFEELAIGKFTSDSRGRLLDIIGNYEVDGVILGCTELPLLITQQDTNMVLLDTLSLHAGAALDYALGM
jgi:aspartate racemase